MTQRDKVKELVGRGLNSYHTKSLQQIDRIEKKNKEQNHKISILSNELDNDYLTKTEEGSVVSLEHSKEGMVYLDELQGNTLVNYCTDGSKEMTLNGDIDVEGTFVTTTEGVDNGKVDVMCEGNTLVNLCSQREFSFSKNNLLTDYIFKQIACPLVKTNTKYTIVANITKNPNTINYKTGFAFIHDGGLASEEKLFESNETGLQVFTLTTKNMETPKGISFRFFNSHGGSLGDYACTDVIILEGDWTNKELPTSYFEGMKSVGQDDTNGHKIEILSRNKNMIQGLPRTVAQDVVSHDIYLEPNKTYSISTNVPFHEGLGMIGKNHNHTNPIITFQNWGENVKRFSTPNNFTKGIYNLIFWKSGLATDETSWTQVEIGTTTTEYTLGAINKKEILINEPLRKLPNGVCDKVVKIDNKHFIERNCGELTLDNNSSVSVPPNGSNWYKLSSGNLKVNTLTFSIPKPSNCANTWGNGTNNNMAISDKFIIYPSTDASAFYDGEKIVFDSSDFKIGINKTKLTSQDIDGFKQWLQSNPVKVVYQLATPVYEPLEIEPVLNTYNDVTHISNNSIIPCNMKIKNTGYNAIIKPSTLYTVALDINKGGTIGMNLGGAKVTTTNNVATVTTPATLADDSLRLYGKGIKGSKVRLLEGDKTNWIPSHFEGMKSSFEDKVQEDGSYKMEILMNNKNLFDISTYYTGSANIEFKDNGFRLYTTKPMTYANVSFKIKVKPFTNYKIYADKKVVSGNAIMDVYDKSNRWLANTDTTFNSKDNVELSFRFYCSSNVSVVGDVQYSNVRLIEIGNNTDYVEHKSNKIQFSSIEPLRKWDRFVFKDGRLMIERGSGVRVFDGNDSDLIFSYEFPSSIRLRTNTNIYLPYGLTVSNKFFNGATGNGVSFNMMIGGSGNIEFIIPKNQVASFNLDGGKQWLQQNPTTVIYQLAEPTYEEVPHELSKIILEGYENGTLFIDTNIPPTSTITYAGETPIVKSVKLNKTEVSNNTDDINDNIIPYLMDMDYRVVCLQLATEEIEGGVSMARLFGGTYEMIKRDILSKRLSRQEYGYRLADYFNAGKLTEQEVRELEDLR